MFSEINWGAVGVFWAAFVTLIQVVTTGVLFLLKRQAQNFQRQAATSQEIETVSGNLKGAIEASGKALRQEFEQAIGAVRAEIEKLEAGDRGMERRVVVLEQTLTHAPKARDLDALRQEIHHLNTTVARFEGRQDENNRVLRLLHEYLMEKGR